MFVACADTMQPCINYVDNPVNHTEPAVADGLSALRVCLEARMVLMSVLSRNNLTSLPAKTAGYSYISKFGATCRYQHLPPEHGETAPDHLTNLHLCGGLHKGNVIEVWILATASCTWCSLCLLRYGRRTALSRCRRLGLDCVSSLS
jgi:hypothetical protein